MREYSTKLDKTRSGNKITDNYRNNILERFEQYYDSKLKKHRLSDIIPWDSHSFNGGVCYELYGSYDTNKYNFPIREMDLHAVNLKNQYFLKGNDFQFNGTTMIADDENKKLTLTPTFNQKHKPEKQVFCQSTLDMYPYDDSYLFISNYSGENKPIANVVKIGKCPKNSEEKTYDYVPESLQGNYAFIRYNMNDNHLTNGKFYCITPSEQTSTADITDSLWKKEDENTYDTITIPQSVCENISDNDILLYTIDTVDDESDKWVDICDDEDNVVRRVPNEGTLEGLTPNDVKRITINESEVETLQNGFVIKSHNFTISKVELKNHENVQTNDLQYHSISSILVNSYCTYNDSPKYKPLVNSEGNLYPLTSYAYTISDFSKIFDYAVSKNKNYCYTTSSIDIAVGAFTNIKDNQSKNSWLKKRQKENWWKKLAYQGVIYAYNTDPTKAQPYENDKTINFDAWKDANSFVFASAGSTATTPNIAPKSYPKGKRISKNSHNVLLFDDAARYAYFGNVCLDLFNIENGKTAVGKGLPSGLQKFAKIPVTSVNPGLQGTYTITFKPEVDRNNWIDYASVEIKTHSVSTNTALLVSSDISSDETDWNHETDEETGITTWTYIANKKNTYYNFVDGQNYLVTSNYKCTYSIDGSEYADITNPSATNDGFFIANHNNNPVKIPAVSITYYKNETPITYEQAGLTTPYRIGYKIDSGSMDTVVLCSYIKDINEIRKSSETLNNINLNDPMNAYVFINEYTLSPTQTPGYKLENEKYNNALKTNNKYTYVGSLSYTLDNQKYIVHYYKGINANGKTYDLKITNTCIYNNPSDQNHNVVFNDCVINDTYVAYACPDYREYDINVSYVTLQDKGFALIQNVCGEYSSSYILWSTHTESGKKPKQTYYNTGSILLNDPQYYDNLTQPRITLTCAHKSNFAYTKKYVIEFNDIPEDTEIPNTNGHIHSSGDFNYDLYWKSDKKSLIGMTYWLVNGNLGTTTYIFNGNGNERYLNMLVSGVGAGMKYETIETQTDDDGREYRVKLGYSFDDEGGMPEYSCDLYTFEDEKIFVQDEPLIKFTGEYSLSSDIMCSYFYINNNQIEYTYSLDESEHISTLIYLLKNKLIDNKIISEHIVGKPTSENPATNIVTERERIQNDNGIICYVTETTNNGDPNMIGTITTSKYIVSKRNLVSPDVIESLSKANNDASYTYIYVSNENVTYTFKGNKKYRESFDKTKDYIVAVDGLKSNIDNIHHMYAISYVISYVWGEEQVEHTMHLRYDFGSANTGNGSKFIYNTDDVAIFNPVPLHITANPGPGGTDQDILGIVTMGDGNDITPIDNRPFIDVVTEPETTEPEEP